MDKVKEILQKYAQWVVDVRSRINEPDSNKALDAYCDLENAAAQLQALIDKEKAEIFKDIKRFKNKPTLYHHICYGTRGSVVIVDHYGVAPKLVCEYAFDHEGKLRDFCCAPGKCPRKGKIKGFKELTRTEKTENFVIDKILEALKKGGE